MFTGIVQEVGILKDRINTGSIYQLILEGEKVLNDISKGDSIAINGVCLTVVNYSENSFTADVMPETLRATNLSNLKNGSRVNLEQAVRPNGFFGGHLVTGHVDGVGKVKRITPKKNAKVVEIAVDPKLTEFMVDKGSIALNGVSLTIMKVSNDTLTVSLIPETWNFTNFKEIKVGTDINIETDLIGKYIAKMIQKEMEKAHHDSQINRNFLKKNGFL